MSTTLIEHRGLLSRLRSEASELPERGERDVRSRARSTQDVERSSDVHACGVAAESRLYPAYNEQAFWYLLKIEQKRSERFGRPFLLLQVSLADQRDENSRMGATIAEKVLSALGLCLRETDFIGWYKSDAVVGAVLTQLADASSPDVCQLVLQRLNKQLCDHLPSEVFGRLQVHVQQPAA